MDRHRRHEKMRQARQIQREIDHQVSMIDKMNERRKQELEKKQNPPISLLSKTILLWIVFFLLDSPIDMM